MYFQKALLTFEKPKSLFEISKDQKMIKSEMKQYSRLLSLMFGSLKMSNDGENTVQSDSTCKLTHTHTHILIDQLTTITLPHTLRGRGLINKGLVKTN